MANYVTLARVRKQKSKDGVNEFFVGGNGPAKYFVFKDDSPGAGPDDYKICVAQSDSKEAGGGGGGYRRPSAPRAGEQSSSVPKQKAAPRLISHMPVHARPENYGRMAPPEHATAPARDYNINELTINDTLPQEPGDDEGTY